MAQADPEDGDLAQQAFDRPDAVADGRRVAGAVGQEHPVGLAGEHVRRLGVRGHDGDAAALVHQELQHGALEAVVIRHHVEAQLGRGARLAAEHIR